MPFGPEVLTPTARPFPRHKADQRRISWGFGCQPDLQRLDCQAAKADTGTRRAKQALSSLRRRRATSSIATTSARMRRASGTFGTIGIAPPPDRIGILCANDTFGVADSPLQGDGFEPVWEYFCQVVFWFVAGSLFGAERPFLVPSPAI